MLIFGDAAPRGGGLRLYTLQGCGRPRLAPWQSLSPPSSCFCALLFHVCPASCFLIDSVAILSTNSHTLAHGHIW